MAARFITGIGTGIETSTVPMYQAELCRASQRGRLVCSEALFVGVGIVIGQFMTTWVSKTCADSGLAYWFDYGMNFTGGDIAWRLPIACQMIFAFVSQPEKAFAGPRPNVATGRHFPCVWVTGVASMAVCYEPERGSA